MQVGDLVHSPCYPRWGIGFVIENDNSCWSKGVNVAWINGQIDWVDEKHLEVI